MTLVIFRKKHFDRYVAMLAEIRDSVKDLGKKMATVQQTLDQLAADEITIATGLTTIGKQLSDEFAIISAGLTALEGQIGGPQPDPSAAVANLAQIQGTAAQFSTLLAQMTTAAGTLPQPVPAQPTS